MEPAFCQLLMDWLTSHRAPPTAVLALKGSWVCHSPPTSVLALGGSWVWREGSESACSVHMGVCTAYGSSRSRDISLSCSNHVLLNVSHIPKCVQSQQGVLCVPLRMESHSNLVFQTIVFISWCLSPLFVWYEIIKKMWPLRRQMRDVFTKSVLFLPKKYVFFVAVL